MKTLLLLCIISFLSLTSCMEINEKIDINKNGQGTYQLDLNMTEMLAMMDALDSGDSIRDVLTEDSKGKSEYAGLPGISKAKNSFDRSTNTVSNYFEFNNLESLNSALSKGNSSFDGISGSTEENGGNKNLGFKTFSGAEKKYSVFMDLEKLRFEFKQMSEDEIESFKGILGTSSYTLEMKFEQAVKSFKGLNLTKGADDKTVIFKMSLEDLFFETSIKKIYLTINLK